MHKNFQTERKISLLLCEVMSEVPQSVLHASHDIIFTKFEVGQILSEVEQSAAVLWRFRYVPFGCSSQSWVWAEVDFHNSADYRDRHSTSLSNFNTVDQCEAELLMTQPIFTSPVFRGGILYCLFLRTGGGPLCPIWRGNRTIVGAPSPNGPIRFEMFFISNTTAS